jgi:hypothetical protein
MIYHDLPFDQYLGIKALSSTSFKDFVKSPALYKWNKDHPRKASKAQEFGTMMHSWVLERDSFDLEYVPVEADLIKQIQAFRKDPIDIENFVPVKKQRRGTNAWKELVALNPGKELMFEEDYENHKRIDTLLKKLGNRELVEAELYKQLMDFDVRIDGQNELSVEFTYKGVLCKARFDSVVGDQIWDVKTTANPYEFEREIVKWKYYIQAGFYWIAFREVFKKEPESFNFLAIPNAQPWADFTRVKLHPEYVEYGIAIVDEYIEEYKRCLDNNEFNSRNVSIEAYKPNYL